MATLGVTVSHKFAPITTQTMRLEKCVEQFYYALLFSGSPGYRNHQEIWRSWAGLGFHVATKVAPPGTSAGDKVTMTMRSNGKIPEISAVASSKETLAKVEKLFRDIDSLRASVVGLEDEARAGALLKAPQVVQGLVKPVTDALSKSDLRPEEKESYLAMIRRGLLAFTHPDVVSIKVSLN